MVNSLETLLSLPSASAQGCWLARHYPIKNDALIKALWELAEQRERTDPHTVSPVVEAAVAMAAVWAEPQMEAVALRIAASMQRALGDHLQALQLYQEASDLYRTLGLALEAARSTVGPIDTLRHLGRYHEALELADWAIGQLRSADDPFTLGKLLVNQGNIFARLANFSQARQAYTEARTLLAALGHHHHIAVVEVNEANVLINLNEFRQAEIHLNHAHGYFVGAGMSNTVARIDHNLACLYFAQGDYQRALTTFDRARTTFAEQTSDVDIAFVDLYRSDIYLALNLWSEALALAQSARAIFETAQMPWETGLLWLNEAVALAHTNETTAANHAFTQARQFFAQTDNILWSAVTDLYEASCMWQNGEVSTAHTQVHRAYLVFQKLAMHTRSAQCAILLGEMALHTSHPQSAIEQFIKSLAYLQGIDLPAITFACHHGLGRAYLLQGNIDAAVLHYGQAIADLQRMQMVIGAEDYKIAFYSNKLHLYEEFISLCLQIDAPDAEQEVFLTIQQIKSRALGETLIDGVMSVLPSTMDNLSTEIDRIKRELNWYYNRLYLPQLDHNNQVLPADLHLRTAILDRERRLNELWQQWRSRDTETALHSAANTTPAAIQVLLPVGTLMLEWFTTDRHCIVFGITREDMWMRRWELPQSDLTAALQRLHFYIDKSSYGPDYHRRHKQAIRQGFEACLQRLHQLLLQPLADCLNMEQVIIAPHGQLHAVPFHALFDGKQYLVETKAVTYVPSATVLYHILAQPAEQPTEPPVILGIAEPTIPYAKIEVERLAKLFPHAAVHYGDSATTDRLSAEHGRPMFLHISSHATFRCDNPLFSALKMADGWLTVNDISRLRSVAPLVTLSACETGRNHVMSGDELIGLWRGFFQAGAQTVLVGLWPVVDQATAHFMIMFYSALQEGQSAAQALRTAQLGMMAEYPQPFFWAPYMLIGDPSFHLPPAPLSALTRLA